MTNDNINHPSHYGGKDNLYEVIKVIQAWGLGFELGNALKYIFRAGKKGEGKKVEDLQKAIKYLEFEIEKLNKDKDCLHIKILGGCCQDCGQLVDNDALNEWRKELTNRCSHLTVNSQGICINCNHPIHTLYKGNRP